MKEQTIKATSHRTGVRLNAWARIQTGLVIGILLILVVLAVPIEKGYSKMVIPGVTRESPVVKAVQKIGPAVVNISSRQAVRRRNNPFSGFGGHPFFDSFFKDFFDPEFENHYRRTSLGSGVIIDGQRGYILTNAHVVEKMGQIDVVLKDEREFKAQIVGADPDSDLAVLRIESKEPLPAVKMGAGQDLMIGETVIAIGNPFGFSHTVTTGVISALNRSVRAEDRVYRDFIQTDASINPGNSGGPLLNIYGELIGINTAVYAKAQGIGFAIPIDRAQKIITDLIQYGEVIQSWIGLIIQPLDNKLARYLNIPDRLRRKNGGMLVKEVLAPSPARKAGIKSGDIVLAIGRRPIESRADYQAVLKETPTGKKLKVTLWRGSQQTTVNVKTATFPDGLSERLAQKKFGIVVDNISTKHRRKYNLQTGKGVVILDLTPEAYLTQIGVRPGDVIRQIDEITVDKLKDYHKAVARYRHKSSLVILLQRKDQLYYLTVKI